MHALRFFKLYNVYEKLDLIITLVLSDEEQELRFNDVYLIEVIFSAYLKTLVSFRGYIRITYI